MLLDTHILLWWLNNDDSLTAEHRKILSSKDNICHISAASIWEISIKTRLGKLEIPSNYVDELTREGFVELAVSWNHCRKVSELPLVHRDPFDRLLIAQAVLEDLRLLTVDERIRKYAVYVI